MFSAIRVLFLVLGFLFTGSTVSAGEALSRAEIVKRAKPATALVEVKPGYGSAFCVHSSGLFVTNEHVIASAGGNVNLILDAAQKTQRVLKAKVIRVDKKLDLAILQAEGADKLPTLSLGTDDKLLELTEVVAFGFPFGTALGRPGAYPAMTISVGSITSLRTDKDGELHRIQLDASLNPGNSGGPIVDSSGKVLGVVVSGIKGVAINNAIPVSHLRRFLSRPEIVFTAPELKRDNLSKPTEFQARVVALLSEEGTHEMELILATGPGKEQRLPMKRIGDRYQAIVTPVPGVEGSAKVRLTVKFEDGSITGEAEDQTFRLGAHRTKVSELKNLRFGKAEGLQGSAKMTDGRTLEGRIADLDAIIVKVGKKPYRLEMKDVVELAVDRQEAPLALSCTLVARLGDKEVARLDVPLYLEGGGPPKIENLLSEKFVKPGASAVPTTYIRAVSSKGDYIGQGKTYNYEGAQITVRKNDRGVSIQVDGWNIVIGAPRGAFLAPGEYRGAKRHAFSDDSPGFDWSGQGRGSNRLAATFVVWEIETRGDEITRLAVDFIQRSEEIMPPLYGMIRFNSMVQ